MIKKDIIYSNQNMLSIQNSIKNKGQNTQIDSVFERIIKDKNGSLVRVRFTIVKIDGSFQGQIISAVPVVSSSELSRQPTGKNKKEIKKTSICLPCAKDSKSIIEDLIPSFISIFPPYFSLDFFMSQPTRAPAFC